VRTVVALAIGTTWPAPALAESQPTEAQLQQAREEFARGRKLEDEDRWSEALPLFERVAAVKMTPQVRFHIALCMEKTGKLESAREGFEQAAREGKPTAPNVVIEANQHLAALLKRIPTVTVTVAKAAPGDEVLLDGKTIAMGEAVAVDPGSHTLSLRRDGEEVATERVDVAEGEPQRFELKVSAQGAGPGRTQRVLGWTALGVGAASAVGMGVFIALRAGALSELDAACPNHTGCDPSVGPIVSRGKTHSTLVNVFAGVSGVALVGGVVLLLTAPSAAPRAPAQTGRIRLVPGVGPGGAFVSLEGSF
jgi:hypothetical protein